MKVLASISLCLLVASIAYAATVEDPSTAARLLIEKKILNKYLVEAKDIVVNYQIFNVGGSAAVDVSVNDESMPADSFEVVSGVPKFSIPRLASGSNTTHTVVYRPKVGVWGRFNFTASDVTYRTSDDAKTIQRAFTSEPGEGFIVGLKEFERKFSPHVTDWLAFATMTLPSLLVPYLLYRRSASKYESSAKSKHN